MVPAEFFKRHWALLGESVINVVQCSFSIRFMLKEGNRTLLILIPKRSSPKEVNHLRPISLAMSFTSISQNAWLI